MTLNLDGGNGVGCASGAGEANQLGPKKPGGLSLGLPLEISASRVAADLVDVDLPLERQGLVFLKIFWKNHSGRSWFVLYFYNALFLNLNFSFLDGTMVL